MNNKLISIIVPIYNAEKFLERCLDSIANQSYKNLEILLIDDGSTDNSGKICDEYAKNDNRFKVIHTLNKGVSSARNTGISNFKGDYVVFIDADDWMKVNYIEYMYELIETQHVDFVRCNYGVSTDLNQEMYNIGMLYGLENRKFYKTDLENIVLKHFLLYKESIPNYSMLLMIKGKILKKIKFNKNLIMMEDVDFYLNLFIKSGSFYFSSEPLYYYYINNNGATKSNKKYLKNIMGIIEANSVLQHTLKNTFKNVNDIISKMNAVHIYLICVYFIKYCKDHDVDDVLEQILQKKEYISMVDNINYSDLPFVKAKLAKIFVSNNKLLLNLFVKFYRLKK